MLEPPIFKCPTILVPQNCYEISRLFINETFNRGIDKFIIEFEYKYYDSHTITCHISHRDNPMWSDFNLRTVSIQEPLNGNIGIIRYVFTRVKHEQVNTLETFHTRIFPFYIIKSLQLQVRSKDDISKPNVTPKLKAAASVLRCEGKMKKQNLVLDVNLDTHRFMWKKAPFRAINDQEMFDYIIDFLKK